MDLGIPNQKIQTKPKIQISSLAGHMDMSGQIKMEMDDGQSLKRKREPDDYDGGDSGQL